jgi:hypothetical protein
MIASRPKSARQALPVSLIRILAFTVSVRDRETLTLENVLL